jgi:hypothetical protein
MNAALSTFGAAPLLAAGVASAPLTAFSALLLLAVPGTRIGALQEGQIPLRPALLSLTRMVKLQLGHLKSIAMNSSAPVISLSCITPSLTAVLMKVLDPKFDSQVSP